MKFLNEILSDLRKGEHIDVYITIVICTSIVVADVLGIVQPEIFNSVVLLALGLLSFNTLTPEKF